MLKQRVITAVVLLAILLPALFYSTPTPFLLVTLVLLAAGAWEWGRLNKLSQTASLALAAACLLMCAGSWAAGLLGKSLPLLWTCAGAAWVLVGGYLLHVGVPGWPKLALWLRVAGGLLVLWLAWLAMAQARTIGIYFLLSVMLLVWTADIAAYFSGRQFGGRFSRSKLAPSLSPGKSWEGVWGGMLGVTLLAAAAVYVATLEAPNFFSLVEQRHGWALMLLASLFLAAMSVVGDLLESLVKRSAGAKDSSGLLPGHGGVLDRVDALLPTLPLAMMIISY